MREDILEHDIEEYLVRRVKAVGGWPLKFVSPGTRGVPDRLLIFPGRVIFVEVKRPGKTSRKLQRAVQGKLIEYGQEVSTVATHVEVDLLLQAAGRSVR